MTVGDRDPILQCICGGGGGGERTPTVSAAPTTAPEPTASPTPFFVDPGCKDYEGFVDTFDNGCSWYAEFDIPGCPFEGGTSGGLGFEDVTANEACVSA